MSSTLFPVFNGTRQQIHKIRNMETILSEHLCLTKMMSEEKQEVRSVVKFCARMEMTTTDALKFLNSSQKKV